MKKWSDKDTDRFTVHVDSGGKESKGKTFCYEIRTGDYIQSNR